MSTLKRLQKSSSPFRQITMLPGAGQLHHNAMSQADQIVAGDAATFVIVGEHRGESPRSTGRAVQKHNGYSGAAQFLAFGVAEPAYRIHQNSIHSLLQQ